MQTSTTADVAPTCHGPSGGCTDTTTMILTMYAVMTPSKPARSTHHSRVGAPISPHMAPIVSITPMPVYGGVVVARIDHIPSISMAAYHMVNNTITILLSKSLVHDDVIMYHLQVNGS